MRGNFAVYPLGFIDIKKGQRATVRSFASQPFRVASLVFASVGTLPEGEVFLEELHLGELAPSLSTKAKEDGEAAPLDLTKPNALHELQEELKTTPYRMNTGEEIRLVLRNDSERDVQVAFSFYAEIKPKPAPAEEGELFYFESKIIKQVLKALSWPEAKRGEYVLCLACGRLAPSTGHAPCPITEEHLITQEIEPGASAMFVWKLSGPRVLNGLQLESGDGEAAVVSRFTVGQEALIRGEPQFLSIFPDAVSLGLLFPAGLPVVVELTNTSATRQAFTLSLEFAGDEEDGVLDG